MGVRWVFYHRSYNCMENIDSSNVFPFGLPKLNPCDQFELLVTFRNAAAAVV